MKLVSQRVDSFIKDNQFGVTSLSTKQYQDIIALVELIDNATKKSELQELIGMMNEYDAMTLLICLGVIYPASIERLAGLVEQEFRPIIKRVIIWVGSRKDTGVLPYRAGRWLSTEQIVSEFRRPTRKTRLFARYECPTCGKHNDFLVSQNCALPKNRYCNMICWNKKRSKFHKKWSLEKGWATT